MTDTVFVGKSAFPRQQRRMDDWTGGSIAVHNVKINVGGEAGVTSVQRHHCNL